MTLEKSGTVQAITTAASMPTSITSNKRQVLRNCKSANMMVEGSAMRLLRRDTVFGERAILTSFFKCFMGVACSPTSTPTSRQHDSPVMIFFQECGRLEWYSIPRQASCGGWGTWHPQGMPLHFSSHMKLATWRYSELFAPCNTYTHLLMEDSPVF